jgi:hypothetical protein
MAALAENRSFVARDLSDGSGSSSALRLTFAASDAKPVRILE